MSSLLLTERVYMAKNGENNYGRPKLPKIIRQNLLEIIDKNLVKLQLQNSVKFQLWQIKKCFPILIWAIKHNQIKQKNQLRELKNQALELCQIHSEELEKLVIKINEKKKRNLSFQIETNKTRKNFIEMICQFKQNIEKLLKAKKTGEMQIAISNFDKHCEGIFNQLKNILYL